jgi:hypothetical protein
MEKIFKSFKIEQKEGTKGLYYKLSVENLKGITTEMFMSESQKQLVELIGKENCSVGISTRTSKDNKMTYKVITLMAGEDSFDFFPKDRGFIPLSIALAKKKETK